MSSAHTGNAQPHMHLHYGGRSGLLTAGSGHEGHQCIHTYEDRRKSYRHTAVAPVPAAVRDIS